MEYSIEDLSRALFIVNRHAKTAPNPKFLYYLKKQTLEKLIQDGKAKKLGLHFSKNPKNSQQRSDLLVSVGEYYFHIPPQKADFEVLPHLGALNETYRNPKTNLPLSKAKLILQGYTGIDESDSDNNHQGPPSKRKYTKPVFKKLGQSYF
ncbi:MAG TPA: hypothetical protein GXX18_13370 [Bacillales bacterium]|nr:hypothetical protein [Bacillales bacterium]